MEVCSILDGSSRRCSFELDPVPYLGDYSPPPEPFAYALEQAEMPSIGVPILRILVACPLVLMASDVRRVSSEWLGWRCS